MAVLLLAVGWARLLDLPAPRGTAAVIVVTGWTAAALAVRAAGMTRPLAPFAALLALGVLLAFGHELVRRERHDLVESVTGTLSGQALALLGGGWVLLPTTPLSLTALTTAAVAAVAARLASLAPVPPAFVGWVSLGAGAVVGGIAGAIVDLSRFGSLILMSVVVAAVVAALDRLVLQVLPGRGVPAALAGGAAPLLAVGTAAYAVARLVA
jgi:hypothetical protein